MIERHPVRHAAAAVVPGDEERLEAELRHHLDLVVRHRPLGVAGVIGAPLRLAAVAVARRSVATTVKSRVSNGAALCHITCDCG
jgi:hypothetical protein